MEEQTLTEHFGKILILGDSGVGKTSILVRYCDNIFNDSQITTIGIDYKKKTFEFDNKRLKLDIWDTAGHERYRSIAESFYKGAHGVILAYSCDLRTSFKNVSKWMEQLDKHAASDIYKVIVANKNDLVDRTVTFEEGNKLADEYGVKFFETSAKTDNNIGELFDTVARDVIKFCPTVKKRKLTIRNTFNSVPEEEPISKCC